MVQIVKYIIFGTRTYPMQITIDVGCNRFREVGYQFFFYALADGFISFQFYTVCKNTFLMYCAVSRKQQALYDVHNF
jgi:hypothetical protein